MQDGAAISADVFASYAREPALAVDGVMRLVGTRAGGGGSRAKVDDGSVRVALRIAVERGRNARTVALAVQEAVYGYLVTMSDARSLAVDVAVAAIDAP